jgi:hypothetical protein
VTRVLTEGVARVRARYLFALARFCHLGPAGVDGLRLGDFALLTEGIDRLVASAPPGGE